MIFQDDTEMNGVLRRLDPRTKLYILPIIVILVLFEKSSFQLLLTTVFFVVAFFLSGITVLQLLRSARHVLILLLITELFSWIWVDTVTVLMTFWRLVLITFFSVLFSKTTEVRDILDGLRQGFPITEGAAMSFTIALDFLPQLGREMEELKAAAISRGAALEDGPVMERIRDYTTLIIPLFRRTIGHAGTLADAMDLRAYDAGKKRTRMEPLRFETADKIAFFLCFLYVAGIITMMIVL